MQTIDIGTLLYQLAYYFPWYVLLVLVPLTVRGLVERALGVRPEVFESHVFPYTASFESSFRALALTVLYFPLFEELVFRGIPLLLFGWLGLIIGSAVWVLMHPAWQLQYLAHLPLGRKIAFTATSTCFYALNAVFYGMMWLDGAGLAAIIYHVAHNAWVSLVSWLREEVPPVWRRLKVIKRQPATEAKQPKRRKEDIEELDVPELKFIVKKSTRSLSDELEEANRFIFVRRKSNSEEER